MTIHGEGGGGGVWILSRTTQSRAMGGEGGGGLKGC